MKTLSRLLFLMTATVVTTAANGGQVEQPAALEALQRADSVLIDVRTEQEFAEGALPGATRIETEDLTEHIATIAPDKNAPVVLYCRSGRRASAAQALLQELGYSQVINAGGYQELNGLVPLR
ncbi:rhodanese-like domain-containing protein [Stutzerimonas xanthomarina]|uniref:Phage shock protein E n=2 Tax=Stutzerimonas xanthomarina TaxID=271420 RepID=A0A1M5RHS8_9GAMM|nr:rhodanese-like domain-containing protein [Stutzerimonas xanthomarina]MCP9339565.1 rhodanese-like domain-containing protein [Stutzerimonas xanthomarina]SEH96446.1 phage shock protein E [Stutzerimonas xanthomarina]SHH25801.1 phage shock protein E [Stutzerimonas xanthomarina DSM 18231]